MTNQKVERQLICLAECIAVFILFLFLHCSRLLAQDHFTSMIEYAHSVASLPASCIPSRPYWVDNGLTSEDCSAGGGTKVVSCVCDETGTGYISWVQTHPTPELIEDANQDTYVNTDADGGGSDIIGIGTGGIERLRITDKGFQMTAGDGLCDDTGVGCFVPSNEEQLRGYLYDGSLMLELSKTAASEWFFVGNDYGLFTVLLNGSSGYANLQCSFGYCRQLVSQNTGSSAAFGILTPGAADAAYFRLNSSEDIEIGDTLSGGIILLDDDAPDNSIVVNSTGQAGFGEPTPATSLHVTEQSGNTRIRAECEGLNCIAGYDMFNDAQQWVTRNNGAISDRFEIFNQTAGYSPINIYTNAPSGSLEVTSVGVGIRGTPDEDFHVFGDVHFEQAGATDFVLSLEANSNLWKVIINQSTGRMSFLNTAGAAFTGQFKIDDAADENLFRIGVSDPSSVDINGGLLIRDGGSTQSQSADSIVHTVVNHGGGTANWNGAWTNEVISDTSNPVIVGNRAMGTEASKSVVSSGAYLLVIRGEGWDGADFDAGPFIRMVANETWTSTAHGNYITFETTENGTTSFTERMRIADDGTVNINVAMQLVPQATPPFSCTSSTSGALYVDDTTTDDLCFCNGSSWAALTGGTCT